jgi:hypothetical protein
MRTMSESQRQQNAGIQAAIEERLNTIDIGKELASEGITTVALDASGQLVEYRPDGSSYVVGQL